MSHNLGQLPNILEQIPNVRFQSSDHIVYIRRNSKPVMWVIDGVQVFDHPEYRDLANIEKVEFKCELFNHGSEIQIISHIEIRATNA